VELSIVVVTYNRADQLRATLDSLGQLHLPDGRPCELVVVDNGSTDRTRAMVEGFRPGSPLDVRYVHEPRQGANHARNRGVRESVGATCVFVDDDMAFPPDWLDMMARALDDHPAAWAIAGRITPRFISGRPDWLPDTLLGYYGSQDLGDHACGLKQGFPIEMNLGLRRWALERVGDFDPRIGRAGTSLRSNDGAPFFHELRAKGGTVVYAPGPRAFHVIPEERTRREWLLERVYWQGVSDVIARRILSPRGRVPHLRDALTAWLSYGRLRFVHGLALCGSCRRSPQNGMQCQVYMHQLLGMARQSLREGCSASIGGS
jgi:glycosyltransferase involved in cell wall biosynthesis